LADACHPVLWVDGGIVSRDEPVVFADDSAFAEGRGCYTSVRVEAGEAWFADRHLGRLQRGAEALGLGAVDAAAVDRALRELSKAAFDDGDGIVRLQLSRRADGRCCLVGIPRGLGADVAEWSAVTSTLRHAGEILSGGHKLTNRVVLGLAMEEAAAAAADEALLFDSADRLVEGARSNIVCVGRDGRPAAPAPEAGAVAGIALQVLLERIPEIAQREIPRAEVDDAREIIAVNSVRGARPIVRLDGAAVGEGRSGAWARRFATVFESR